MAQQSPVITGNDVINAIRTLSSTNLAHQRRANEWLVNFHSLKQSWSVSQELLGHSDVQVQLFAANTLYRKIRSDHSDLSPSDLQHVRGGLLDHLQKVYAVAAAPPASAAPAFLTHRLAAAVAAAGLRGARGCAELMGELGALAQQNAQLAQPILEILAVLPSEFDKLDTVGYVAKLKEIRDSEETMLQLVKYFVSHAQSAASQCLDCVTEWFHTQLSLGKLLACGLLQNVLELAARPATAQSALRLLVAGLAAGDFSDEPAYERAIEMIEATVANHFAAQFQAALQNRNIEVIRSIGELACALVERESNHVAKGSNDSLRVVELVHACLSYAAPDRSVCEMAFDPLSRLQCVETNERHPRLQRDLFLSALNVLISKQLCFTANFSSFDELPPDELDADAFDRFRSAAAESLLCPSFDLLGVDYVQRCGRTFTASSSTSSWQSAEAALFALESVQLTLMERLSSPKVRTLLAEELTPVLKAIFQGASQHHTQLIRREAAFLGAYAMWIRELSAELSQTAMNFLVECYKVDVACEDAGTAFTQLCIAGSRDSAAPLDISAVIAACHRGIPLATSSPASTPSASSVWVDFSLSSANDESASSSAFYAGLGALIDAQLRGDECEAALKTAVGPIFQALSAQTSSNSPLAPRNFSRAAHALARLVRAMLMNASAERAHPVLCIADPVWRAMNAGMRRWPTDYDVISAACSVFDAFVKVAGAALNPAMPSMLEILEFSFAQSHSPNCLRTVAQTVKTMCRAEGAVGQFSGTFERLLAETDKFTRSDVSSYPDVVAAFASLAGAVVRQCPAAACSQGGALLERTLQWSGGVLERSAHFASLSKTLSLWHGIFANDDEQFRTILRSRLSAPFIHGAVGVLLMALLNHAGSRGRIAGVIWYLIETTKEPVLGCIEQLLSNPEFPSARASPQDRVRFMQCLRRLASAAQQQRAAALLKDFGSILDGSATGASLVAYELDPKDQWPRAGAGGKPEVIVLE
eukprot:940858_1